MRLITVENEKNVLLLRLFFTSKVQTLQFLLVGMQKYFYLWRSVT